jgi:HlyD family secretion protein
MQAVFSVAPIMSQQPTPVRPAPKSMDPPASAAQPPAVLPPAALPIAAPRPARARSRRGLIWAALAGLLIVGGAYAALPLLLGPRVQAYAAHRQDLVATVVASGRVQTPYRASISSQMTGTVSEVPVEEGQRVVKGQTLVVLQSEELGSAVTQAQGAVAEARAHIAQMQAYALPAAREAETQASAALADARKTYGRSRTLLAQGFETKANFDDAQKALDTAEAQDRAARLQVQTNSPGGSDYVVAQTALAQARANLSAAQARAGYARVLAPTDGVLIARDVERGDVVTPGKTLMVLSPNAETQLVINVDEKNLSQLAVGQSATASADAFPDRRFPAKVVYINPGVDASTAAVEVKLAASSPPAYLRQDMTVSVDILTATRPHALVLPTDAVRDAFTDHPSVLVVEDGRATSRRVTLGVRGGGQVEVLSGIREGELAIAVTEKARPGQRVRAVRHA